MDQKFYSSTELRELSDDQLSSLQRSGRMGFSEVTSLRMLRQFNYDPETYARCTSHIRVERSSEDDFAEVAE